MTTELNLPLGLFCIAIAVVITFVLVAPVGTVARATNAVGNFIQKIYAFIYKIFTKIFS